MDTRGACANQTDGARARVRLMAQNLDYKADRGTGEPVTGRAGAVSALAKSGGWGQGTVRSWHRSPDLTEVRVSLRACGDSAAGEGTARVKTQEDSLCSSPGRRREGGGPGADDAGAG